VALVDDPALDWGPAWAPDGKSIFFLSNRAGTMAIYRIAVDETTGRPGGPPEPATPSPATFVRGFSVARDGRVVLAAEGSTYTLWRAPLDVQNGRVATPEVAYRGSRQIFDNSLSPDGRSLAFTLTGGQEDLFVVRADGTGLRQLTDDAYRQRGLAWFPDGSRVVFQSDRNGTYDLWVIEAGGGTPALLATSPTRAALDPVVSPDGRQLAMDDEAGKAWIVDLGATPAQNVLHELPPSPAGRPFQLVSWSPDGARLAGGIQSSERYGALYVFEIATRTYHRISESGTNPHFVDARHVVWESERAIELFDLDTGAQRALVAQPRLQAYRRSSASRDGRWLAWLEVDQQSDIWLATPQSPPTRR
jgi:Tol biopolymer transport system component